MNKLKLLQYRAITLWERFPRSRRRLSDIRYLRLKEEIPWEFLHMFFSGRTCYVERISTTLRSKYHTVEELAECILHPVIRPSYSTPVYFSVAHIQNQEVFYVGSGFLGKVNEVGEMQPLIALMYHQDYIDEHIGSILTCGSLIPQYLNVLYSPDIEHLQSKTLIKELKKVLNMFEEAGINTYKSEFDIFESRQLRLKTIKQIQEKTIMLLTDEYSPNK